MEPRVYFILEPKLKPLDAVVGAKVELKLNPDVVVGAAKPDPNENPPALVVAVPAGFEPKLNPPVVPLVPDDPKLKPPKK